MSSLSLFPTRVAIGRTSDGRDVLMTREFATAMAGLLNRVGGEEGLSTTELEALIEAQILRSDVLEGEILQEVFDFTAPPTPPGDALPPTEYGPTIAALAQQIAELQMALNAAPSIDMLSRQIAELQMALADVPAPRAPDYSYFLQAYAEPVVQYVDWARPGAIGGLTANVGKFSTVQAVGGFGCNSKTPQTAFALGAAAVDLPTVIILANNLRTMSINNGTGS